MSRIGSHRAPRLVSASVVILSLAGGGSATLAHAEDTMPVYDSGVASGVKVIAPIERATPLLRPQARHAEAATLTEVSGSSVDAPRDFGQIREDRFQPGDPRSVYNTK